MFQIGLLLPQSVITEYSYQVTSNGTVVEQLATGTCQAPNPCAGKKFEDILLNGAKLSVWFSETP